MATTFVEPARPLKDDLNAPKLLDQVHRALEIAQGDEDKAGTIEDSCYYEGWRDALVWVQNQMTVPEEQF